ncbi:MAG TPA: hypothetical protein VMW42_06550, partial [Desulfatiglandales bacterium]|nr:hypothetical protein [Desulfatiglandales bacterium]
MKIFAVFILILLLNRLRLQLNLSLLIGSLILGFWMGLGPIKLSYIALNSLKDIQTISLILVVGLILVMSRIMKESGHMDRLAES